MKLCVFIGASFGKDKAFYEATIDLGKELANRKITLIYGGGKLGLMGILADTVLAHGGTVIGVITEQLYQQEAHLGLTELHVVKSMQKRKKLMAELADGFIAFPGGLGTIEEIGEVLNAIKIKIYNKPFGLLNIKNYYDKFIEFIQHAIEEEFLKQDFHELAKITDHPIAMLDLLTEQQSVYLRVSKDERGSFERCVR